MILVPLQQNAEEMQFVGGLGLAKLYQWAYPAHHVGAPLVSRVKVVVRRFRGRLKLLSAYRVVAKVDFRPQIRR
jgi:hypothetical protein